MRRDGAAASGARGGAVNNSRVKVKDWNKSNGGAGEIGNEVNFSSAFAESKVVLN